MALDLRCGPHGSVNRAASTPEINDISPRLRMADFAAWSMAAEPAFGLEHGTFLAAYQANRKNANTLALEASLFAGTVLESCAGWEGVRDEWDGTMTDLDELSILLSEERRRSKEWPKTARGLSSPLRRLAPNLRRAGVEIEFEREPGDQGVPLYHPRTTMAPSIRLARCSRDPGRGLHPLWVRSMLDDRGA